MRSLPGKKDFPAWEKQFLSGCKEMFSPIMHFIEDRGLGVGPGVRANH
jgi:hypothetical protein